MEEFLIGKGKTKMRKLTKDTYDDLLISLKKGKSPDIIGSQVEHFILCTNKNRTQNDDVHQRDTRKYEIIQQPGPTAIAERWDNHPQSTDSGFVLVTFLPGFHPVATTAI